MIDTFFKGLGLDFANTFFNTWLRDLEKDTNSLVSILKRAEIDGKLLVSINSCLKPQNLQFIFTTQHIL